MKRDKRETEFATEEQIKQSTIKKIMGVSDIPEPLTHKAKKISFLMRKKVNPLHYNRRYLCAIYFDHLLKQVVLHT